MDLPGCRCVRCDAGDLSFASGTSQKKSTAKALSAGLVLPPSFTTRGPIALVFWRCVL
jgi:hypothetical protein